VNTLPYTDCTSSYRPTLVVVSCCASGHAEPILGQFDGITRATVRFADLNLAVAQDVAELYRRIEYTARKVCREHLRDREECTRRAVSNAITKIDRPALTAYHRSRVVAKVPS
jgi:UrcA family protein